MPPTFPCANCATEGAVKCGVCRGTGKTRPRRNACTACAGTGWVNCPWCRGTGTEAAIVREIEERAGVR